MGYIKNESFKNISFEKFREKIKSINIAESVSGISYEFKVENNEIIGIRKSTMKPFTISIKNLYEAYTNLNIFNTSALKEFVNRVQSPSLAILMGARLVISN